MEAEAERFALNALGAPEQVISGHLLDQAEGLGGQLGATVPISRFEPPGEAKSLAMPALERIGLNDVQRLLAVGDAAGEDQQSEAISAVQLWMLDL
jgi:hypothetical protein